MNELYAAFQAALGEAARASFAEAETRDVLARQYAAARAAWPELAIAPAELGRELGRRLGSAGPAALAACHAADVYLAIACCNRDAVAIERVRAIIEREVGAVAGKTGARPDQIADVRSELARILLVDEPPRSAALRDYAGRGDFRNYVRVIATRDLIRVVERGRREAPQDGVPDGANELFALLSRGDDPELDILREHYRDPVATSLRAALARLGERERALLRYQLVDGWSVDRVGGLYGVHRATAARWISAAREQLGELIRDEVAKSLAIPVGEVDSIVRLVQSRIDVSLERLIAG